MNNRTVSLFISQSYDEDTKVPLADPDGIYEPSLYVILFLSLCYGSISVVAVIGNGLVIWVIATSRRLRNVTNYYIANLALADILIGMFAIPFEFQSALLQRWILPHFMCAFCPFVKIVCVSVSVLTLAVIALDRHRAILTPFTARVYRMHIKVIILSIWIVSGLIAEPVLYAMRTVPMEFEGQGYYFCYPLKLPPHIILIYRFVLVILQYVLPLAVISPVYARIGLALWAASAPGNAQSDRDAQIMRKKKKVIKMLIIIVILFAICWLPLQTYNVLEIVYPDINRFEYMNMIWLLFNWLAMSNSCCNPFIYGIYNENFKREFRNRLPKPCWRYIHRSDSLQRDLSGRDSSRFEWRRNSTSLSKTSSKHMSLSLP